MARNDTRGRAPRSAGRSGGPVRQTPGPLCPACGTGRGQPALRYHGVPGSLFPMPEEVARRVPKRDLVLAACRRCGHLFQPSADESLLRAIYETYYAYYTQDDQEGLLPLYKDPFNSLFSLIVKTQKLASKHLVEIGCSKPANLAPFLEYGFSCTGIDPSPLGHSAGMRRGIEIIAGSYESTMLAQKASVIVSRLSMEHIVDLAAVVEKMRQDLHEGGLVFVQVPNTAYYFTNGQPFFGAHEHIHYFTLRSLCRLFRRFGMPPVAFYEESQPSILACFKKGCADLRVETVNWARQLAPFRASLAIKRQQIKDALRTGDRVVLYGCGLLMIWVLTLLDGEQLDRIMLTDDNERVWGKCVPAYGLKVQRPSPGLLRDAARVVLTLNPHYHGGVLGRLADWKVRAEVVTVAKDGVRRRRIGR